MIRSTTFFVGKDVTEVKKGALDMLKRTARKDPLKRARLCLHKSHDDRVQEMLIVFCKGSYIRPHRHLNGSESFHIIEGWANFIFFDDDGNVAKRMNVGTSKSDKAFLLRLNTTLWHTVVPLSKYLIVKESSSGPYRKERNRFAPWSPSYGDTKRIKLFFEKITKK